MPAAKNESFSPRQSNRLDCTLSGLHGVPHVLRMLLTSSVEQLSQNIRGNGRSRREIATCPQPKLVAIQKRAYQLRRAISGLQPEPFEP